MKDDRLRVPIDDQYLYAVGLATICFARLEWDAVWCCEKLQTDYINSIARKTAGHIANDLIKLAATHTDTTIIATLGRGADEFKRLVNRRNDLVHAKPGTAENKKQRLFRGVVVWTIPMVNDVADEFVAVGDVLNHHHHTLL